jgi:hypothetical protein
MRMPKNIWEVKPDQPYSNHSGSVEMRAERCDLVGGFDIILSRHCTVEQLINGIAEAIGHHAVNIRDNLPPGVGFAGYGHHHMRLLWDDGTEADIHLVESGESAPPNEEEG